jgi:hypothetical protein
LGARPPPPRFLCVLLGGAPPSPAVTSQLSLLLFIFILRLGELSPPPPHFLNSSIHLFYSFLNIFILFPVILAVMHSYACVVSTGCERICARRPCIRRFAMAKSGGLRLRLPTEYSISWRRSVEHNLPPGFGDTISASCTFTCHVYSCFALCFFNLSKALVKMY